MSRFLLLTIGLAMAGPLWADPVPVNPDNFARAESDLYFSRTVERGGFGAWDHTREPTPLDQQTVIRLNRDTLYSAAVFDLDAAPVTITLPDAGDRFMSLQVIDQDQYTYGVFYDPGPVTLTREEVGTRYVIAAVRTLVDPSDPEDLAQAHALQDATLIDQADKGTFEIPEWDRVSQDKVRTALLELATTLPETERMYGSREEVDAESIRFQIGAPMGWGANPPKEAVYLNVTPEANDGATVHRLTVGDVPVDGFWSISVYNAEGYFEPNPLDAYSLNNITAEKAEDGSITVQFGGCEGEVPNCLPTPPDWNYMVRLYRPSQEILDGTWTFPEAEIAS
ncbi:DUF1254 domain-containing protein [Rubellimicrobium roseum]|uniref:DUF1254 domain-containing protein n=1 Tax=Rubellimicrobium roseum TaxID=687525 RepID=A0A5C4N920_9RHOB|nr:DUF1254 domain-containing protein [Rubellimicrobium roseum]TNC66565.1 DUF1254 domain-containing protein [Rubellimicrobium roseum]